MNRILLSKENKISEDTYRLNDPNAIAHIQKVLQKKEGEEVKCCLINQGLFQGKIQKISNESIDFTLEEKLPSETSPVELYIGLSRPPTCQKILEHGTTMGVSSFHFTRTRLGEKSFYDSKLFQNKHYEKYLKLGLSQSDSYYQLPSFELSARWAPEEIEGEQKFVLDPFTEDSFADVSLDFSKKIILAIGPERGWHSSEVDDLVNCGFKRIRLGSAKLRVELATYSALSQLELLKMKALQ